MNKRVRAALLGTVLLLPWSMASAGPIESQVITAVVFNFPDGHEDFDLPTGYRVSGNVAAQLQDHPQWAGGGREVLAEFEAPDGQAVAPLTYGLTGPCTSDLGSAGAWGTVSSGKVSRFNQWYRHVLGVNVPVMVPMMLTFHDDDGFGYALSDLAFAPLGPRDHSFTWNVSLFFVYESCADQEIAIESAGDVWMFIDGQLVIDYQQRGTVTHQSIELDRLGLIDGKIYPLRIFYASRGGDSRFGFKVYNTKLSQPRSPVNPAGAYD